jgi:sugar porter (SP) family MFS transporter
MITTPLPTLSRVKPEYDIGYVTLISLVAAMGGLLLGYDLTVTGSARPFFEAYFGISGNPGASAWSNNCVFVGCVIGALVAGGLSNKFGPKSLLILSALLFVVTSLGNAWAHDFNVFIAWRILGGVAIGLASILSPLYIAEVAPATLRGRLVSLNQLTIVVGVLAAQIINWYIGRGLPAGATPFTIAGSWYGQHCWRIMFELTAVPSLVFFAGLFLVPESPRWLVRQGMQDIAGFTLTRIGGRGYADDEIADVQATLHSESADRVRFAELLAPKMRQVLLLGVALAVFQQWCGINLIFNYADDIFRAAGYDISFVLKNIAWTGSVTLAFTFVAVGMVDKLGRRPLMLFGSLSLAVIYLILAFCYHAHVQGFPVLLLVLLAIACYALSLAPITWVVISEIFPNRIRGAAMAVAVASLWAACFGLSDTFPILNGDLGPAKTFGLYAFICLLGFIFILRKLPETKNKTLEELERELVD